MGKIAEAEAEVEHVQARVRELIQQQHELLSQIAPLEKEPQTDPDAAGRLAALRRALSNTQDARHRLEDEDLQKARQKLDEAQDERHRLMANIETDERHWAPYFPLETELLSLSERIGEMAAATKNDTLETIRRELRSLSFNVTRHRTGLDQARKRLESY